MSELLPLSERDLATLSGCSFETAKGRCGSQDFGSNPYPQGQLGVLYRGYYESQGLQAPLEDAPLLMAIADAMEAAGCGSDDRFCADHGEEMDMRLRYELARQVGEPEMGLWMASPEAGRLAVRSRLTRLEERQHADYLATVDIPDVELSELEL